MHSSLELGKEPVLRQLDFGQLKTASGIQDGKRVRVCCVMSPCLWRLLKNDNRKRVQCMGPNGPDGQIMLTSLAFFPGYTEDRLPHSLPGCRGCEGQGAGHHFLLTTWTHTVDRQHSCLVAAACEFLVLTSKTIRKSFLLFLLLSSLLSSSPPSSLPPFFPSSSPPLSLF